jgi:HTH-type transcriptional repressor of NAD biosynthesis genes
MKKGLLLGKFMPFHNGHIALINFALAHTESLTVLVCANKNEPIDGATRYNWIKNYYLYNQRVEVVHTEYDNAMLPAASASSQQAAEKWTAYLKENFPETGIFISSEPYGEYVAAHWGIGYLCFDERRNLVPISATDIRNHPFKNWLYIPETVRPYFVKKIGIVGSESTGKSILAERLAAYYKTTFVPEMARDIIEKTVTCTIADLYTIAALHARTIIEKNELANKLLFVDTDINITKSYGHFLFNAAIIPENWINEANRFALYLFLETDCPYVQDGTRLDKKDREKLNGYHKKAFAEQGISYHTIRGNWEQRFAAAIKIIDQEFFEETV